MRFSAIILFILIFTSCMSDKSSDLAPIVGTWRLLTGTLIQKNDTTITDWTKNKEFIKVINQTHFSFLGHDLSQGKDSASAFYTSGGGNYTLKDSNYTEHLQYCSDRAWEKHDFPFTINVSGDTLIIKGIEKVEDKGINRLNIEKYARVKM